MALKPWYKVVTPREDLRDGRPLDASEFAVHLNHVRDGRAPPDYQDPARFFERTFLTKGLSELATGVLRRLAGKVVETSPIYNMTTQFGGGKTHALTLLYHLATGGDAVRGWKGAQVLLDAAGVKVPPKAATAVFVGTEFDAISGRGGDDGTPLRKTPWGEIAFQLGGAKGFAVVAAHEEAKTAPSTEVIRKLLPKDQPTLILMDELMNFVSRNRNNGLGTQLYNFLQNLTEEVRSHDNVVLAVSIPASEMEMTVEDQADYGRFKKILDRLGKAVIMSAEHEISEIIRRRLFEWGGLPDDGKKTAAEYSEWVLSHRAQLPSTFPIDSARDAFAATYPFHPMALSVFERKWQSLPRFQQTRGVLRLLALWVARAYKDGYEGAHRDTLIGTGTAPLDDPMFRAAVFEQLGEGRLEGAVTTDIIGKQDSHAVRLDKESVDTIRKARLHQKVATVIFFESNGGQVQARTEATVPEIRLAVAEPDLDIGNVETVLDQLATSCYFLSSEKGKYRFSLAPNLNKLLADRRASVPPAKIDERVREEVQKVFALGSGVEKVFFPKDGGAIPDRPLLTLVIASPEQGLQDRATKSFVETATKEKGASSRTFKSALLWSVSENADVLREEARKLLAWKSIDEEQEDLRLDESQRRKLSEQIKSAANDLKEAVWRSFKNLLLLDKNNEMKAIDLGHIHSSMTRSLLDLILQRLRTDGDLESVVSPAFLVRNWPPAFKEWSTRALRDAFYASPSLPRLMSSEALRDTVSKGVASGVLAYVTKRGDGEYDPFLWNATLPPGDIEFSDDVFVIQRATAEAYQAAKKKGDQPGQKGDPSGDDSKSTDEGGAVAWPPPRVPATPAASGYERVSWAGDINPQKWVNFYTKVLSRFATTQGLKIRVQVEIAPVTGVSQQKLEETKTALRELGLADNVEVVGAVGTSPDWAPQADPKPLMLDMNREITILQMPEQVGVNEATDALLRACWKHRTKFKKGQEWVAFVSPGQHHFAGLRLWAGITTDVPLEVLDEAQEEISAKGNEVSREMNYASREDLSPAFRVTDAGFEFLVPAPLAGAPGRKISRAGVDLQVRPFFTKPAQQQGSKQRG